MASEARSTTGSTTGFQSYIPHSATLRECTPRAIILGTLLGMVFGASSLYLVLKVGLTVSASIPVAVISLTLFRLWSKAGGRDATILENNIVQTAGSAGESIAFGLGVTMPAILILGFDLERRRALAYKGSACRSTKADIWRRTVRSSSPVVRNTGIRSIHSPRKDKTRVRPAYSNSHRTASTAGLVRSLQDRDTAAPPPKLPEPPRGPRKRPRIRAVPSTP